MNGIGLFMRYVVTLGISLLLFACTSDKERAMTRLVMEWDGREIVYPLNSYFTLLGKDTVQRPVRHAQYSIVSYVDTIGCTSCKLKLPKWKEFINQLDMVSSEKVPVLMYFYTNKKEELLFLLKRDQFNIPICIDENDSLNKLNHFPSEIAFQTFLLDRGNKVIAIGNPIHNPKVKELYLKIIRGESLETASDKDIVKTEVDIAETSLSLGSFDWRKEQKITFTLKNTGNKPLVIADVNTSCGCTSVDYSKEPVPLGKEITLNVTYKAEHAEYFNKTITVYCNTENSPIILNISGNAK